MIIQGHPTQNAFCRALALGLAEAGMLQEFWTTLDYPTTERWARLLPPSLRREGRRRQVPATVKPFTHLQPWRELGRLLGPRVGLSGLTRHETGLCSVDQVYHALDQRIARRISRPSSPEAVYLYEDGAVTTFAAARSRGIRCLYDLPIGYWRAARRILSEEAERSPEWAATMHGNLDSPAKLARKDAELALADTVFVASSFTASTLAEAPTPPQDIVQVPYGAPLVAPGLRPAQRKPGEPLKVLFVGSLGQRKGLSYLLEAMQLVGSAMELTLIGTVPSAPCAPLRQGLARHRHINSLPHDAILAEMAQHHLFVFPSLFEGFGLVLLEAMACGLPIIATAHTAAPDILAGCEAGVIVPIRSAEAIATALDRMEADEQSRRQMSTIAQDCAAQFTWDGYQQKMIQAIRTRL